MKTPVDYIDLPYSSSPSRSATVSPQVHKRSNSAWSLHPQLCREHTALLGWLSGALIKSYLEPGRLGLLFIHVCGTLKNMKEREEFKIVSVGIK